MLRTRTCRSRQEKRGQTFVPPFTKGSDVGRWRLLQIMVQSFVAMPFFVLLYASVKAAFAKRTPEYPSSTKNLVFLNPFSSAYSSTFDFCYVICRRNNYNFLAYRTALHSFSKSIHFARFLQKIYLSRFKIPKAELLTRIFFLKGVQIVKNLFIVMDDAILFALFMK